MGSFIIPAVLAVAGMLFIVMGLNGLFFFRFLSTILIACGIVLIGISFSRITSPQLKVERGIPFPLKGSWDCKKCKSLNLKDDRVCYSCGRNSFIK